MPPAFYRYPIHFRIGFYKERLTYKNILIIKIGKMKVSMLGCDLYGYSPL
jgi:hypothetical protein